MLKLLLPLLLLPIISNSWLFTAMALTSMMIVTPLTLCNSFLNTAPLNTLFTTDPMSSTLSILTMWIAPLMIMSSQAIYTNHSRSHQFHKLITTLTLILIMSFTTSNLFMFYVFFEASLIPTLMIVLNWGYQPERLQAGMYLMLYTVTASLPLLMGISFMFVSNTSTNMFTMTNHSGYTSFLWWMMINTAFMVKLPVFFSHLWLPKAHVEAPVAGSMVLAAILLKLGGYGLLRMTTIMAPPTALAKMLILSASLWGGFITSIICVRQSDMKSLIAYSSVGHMSLVMAGVLTNSKWGQYGALVMMLAHGLVSSAMFSLANITYEKSGSRSMIMNKGTLTLFPAMSFMWFIMSAANMSAPPSINLLAEIMLITSSISHALPSAIPLGLMGMTAAAYSLILYSAINHGPMSQYMNFHITTWWRDLMIPTIHFLPVIILIMHPTIISIW